MQHVLHVQSATHVDCKKRKHNFLLSIISSNYLVKARRPEACSGFLARCVLYEKARANSEKYDSQEMIK